MGQFLLPGFCVKFVFGTLFAFFSSMLTVFFLSASSHSSALVLPEVKLPFPLTLGFKSMMQRGIETPDMDVRWVSSLSWYFLNFFGLNGLFRLLLGSENGRC